MAKRAPLDCGPHATKRQRTEVFLSPVPDNFPQDKLPSLGELVLGGRCSEAKILLSRQRAAIDERDQDGMTPLLQAVGLKNAKMASILIENKASLEVRDLEGRTALAIAASNGCIESTKVLLAARANLEAPDYSGRTVLNLAACNGELKILELLISEG
eukprot:1326215-Amorphochlora_amoeboformis.AAC.1